MLGASHKSHGKTVGIGKAANLRSCQLPRSTPCRMVYIYSHTASSALRRTTDDRIKLHIRFVVLRTGWWQ